LKGFVEAALADALCFPPELADAAVSETPKMATSARIPASERWPRVAARFMSDPFLVQFARTRHEIEEGINAVAPITVNTDILTKYDDSLLLSRDFVEDR
jgi:hypothetical protein